MKTIRLTENWQDRDSGQGSVSNPSHHSNNNSTSHVHGAGLLPSSSSIGNLNRNGGVATASQSTAAVVLASAASVNNVTVNQVVVHQSTGMQPAPMQHENGVVEPQQPYCNRKPIDIFTRQSITLGRAICLACSRSRVHC